MGSQQSAEEGPTSTAERGKWVRSAEFFENRVPPLPEEDLLREYYRSYLRQCEAAAADTVEFAHNEEFQATVDSLDEDMQQRTAELHQIAAKHQHDIISVCVNLIDDVVETDYAGARVEMIPHVGTTFVRGGFFFFHWASYIGEKLGRLELRVCRRFAELQQNALHVPLTYHVVYKGEAVTVQALCPVTPTTRIDPASSPEIVSLTKEVLDSFNLKPFEAFGATHTVPPDVEIHIARDGRYYSICNFQWLPPWPRSKGERYEIAQRFSCFRPEILVSQPLTISCRAFHASAFVTDNTTALQLTRLLVDQFVHDVPKIVGTVDDEGPDTILVHFRRCGFNYSCLGILLLSLLRNVSPPQETVRTVTTELFARGIKQFITASVAPIGSAEDDADGFTDVAAQQQQMRHGHGGGRRAGADAGAARDEIQRVHLYNRQLLRPGALPSAAGLDRSMSITIYGNDDHQETTSRLRASVAATAKSRIKPHFLTLVESVLTAFLAYPGAPVPRSATLFESAVLPPTDLFGGEVLPMIYRKFRLLPTDVDLYRSMPQSQKIEVYRRVCALLGIEIQGGHINRVLPIIVGPSVPSLGLPTWIEKRLEALGKKLFVGAPLRSLWVQQGSATIVLLRHQPAFWDYYEVVKSYMETLTPSNHLWHTLQNSMDRALLNDVVDLRTEALPNATIADKVLLINLMRKQAFAAFDEECFNEARSIMEDVLQLAVQALEVLGNPFAPQYRRCCSEAVLYNRDDPDRGADIEATMLRNIARFCKPDTLVGQDYLQMGVVQASVGHRSDALVNLQKARRTLASCVGEDDPRTHRCEAVIAAVMMAEGSRNAAVAVLRDLIQRETQLVDVIEAAGVALEDTAPTEILHAIEQHRRVEQAREVEDEPFLFIPHAARY